MSTGYLRAESIEQAVGWLQRYPQSRVLAGGQSLLPVLRWGLGEASHLIDLQDVARLQSIERIDDGFWIGAMVTHAAIARHPQICAHLPFYAEVAAQIADPQVREAGTIGGSLVHHDPAACWPAAVLASSALLITSQRQLAADDFFQGLFATSLMRDEILLGLRVACHVRGGYRKNEHPASRFAMPGVALARLPDGVIRVAVTGLGQGVVRWPQAEQALRQRFSQHALDDVALSASQAQGDLHASAEYRCFLARVLCRRLVASMANELPHPLRPAGTPAGGTPKTAPSSAEQPDNAAARIEGEAFLMASPEAVWQTLLDTEVLKVCIPGCEQIHEDSPLTYVAQVRVGLGPIAAKFSSRVNLSIVQPVSSDRSAHFVLQAEGDAGRLGNARARIDIRLHPVSGGTRLTWSALPQLQGQLAQVGQRLTQISAKRLSEEFFARLTAILGGQSPGSVRPSLLSVIAMVLRRWWRRWIVKKGESP